MLKMKRIIVSAMMVLMFSGFIFASAQQATSERADAFVNFALQQVGKTKTDLGLTGQWCGRFVGYCGKHSGMSDIIPTSSQMSGADGAIKYGHKYGAATYYFFDDMSVPDGCVRADLATFSPEVGDIVTFRRLTGNSLTADYAARYSHLAIVWKVDSEYIHVVHGNWGSDGKVKSNTRFKRNGVTSFWHWEGNKKVYNYYCVGAYTRPAFSDGTVVQPSDSSVVESSTGHVYTLVPMSMTWSEARNYARAKGQGYDLATMDGSSAKEQSIIENLVVDFGHACWLGGTKSSGSWQWVSGVPISVSDSRWDDGEPSGAHSSGSKENYLGIYGNSTQTSYATIRKWNDFQNSSSTIKGFVIEYTPDTSSSTPPTGRLPGDADDNGVVNLNDVRCMLRYSAGEVSDINFNNADTNANDQMDMYDVLLLMQYISGWEVPLK